MPRRVDVRTVAGLAWRALLAGLAWLGAAVIVTAGEPPTIAGALAVIVAVAGGVARTSVHWPLAVRVSLALAVVLAIRAATGPAGAAAALVLVAVGATLTLRPRDAVLGLAAYGAVVCLLGSAHPRLLAVFWLAGAIGIGLRRSLSILWRRIRRTGVVRESPSIQRLAPER